jgi:hypothetical protein
LKRASSQRRQGSRGLDAGLVLALWRKPEDLTSSQRSALAAIERDNRKLFARTC